jgi:hypothetical protein
MLHHIGGWGSWEGNCFKSRKDSIVDIIPNWLFSLSISMNGLQSNVKHSTSLNSSLIMFVWAYIIPVVKLIFGPLKLFFHFIQEVLLFVGSDKVLMNLHVTRQFLFPLFITLG